MITLTALTIALGFGWLIATLWKIVARALSGKIESRRYEPLAGSAPNPFS